MEMKQKAQAADAQLELERRQKELEARQQEIEKYEKETKESLEAEKAKLAKEREDLIAKAKADGMTQAQAEKQATEIQKERVEALAEL